jgi:hypothetical protein
MSDTGEQQIGFVIETRGGHAFASGRTEAEAWKAAEDKIPPKNPR